MRHCIIFSLMYISTEILSCFEVKSCRHYTGEMHTHLFVVNCIILSAGGDNSICSICRHEVIGLILSIAAVIGSTIAALVVSDEQKDAFVLPLSSAVREDL